MKEFHDGQRVEQAKNLDVPTTETDDALKAIPRKIECDGCGRFVPYKEVKTAIAYGCEGDFCSRCRGVEED